MPPTVFPRSVQVARALKGLRALGWRSTVIAPALDNFPAAIIEAALGDAYERHYAVTRIDLSRADQEHGPLAARWRERLNGDAAASDQELWIRRAAAAAGRAIRDTRADALITFAQPWTDHLAGLRVHARHPGVPWVAHFSDPWSDSLYDESSGAARQQETELEQDVIAHADAVVFTNSYAADLVMRKYPPSWKQKTRVIPHAVDFDIVPPDTRRPGSGAPLRIAHVGNLFARRRTAQALFEALARVNARRPLAGRLAVVFIGEGTGFREAQEQAFIHRLEPIVSFESRIPYVESLSRMRDSDVLLLIDAPSEINAFLPSKLVDYLMTDRPVLALTPPAGPSADLMRRFEYPMAAPDDVAAIEHTIVDLLQRHEGGRLPAAAPRDAYQDLTVAAIAREFDALLESIVRKAACGPPG